MGIIGTAKSALLFMHFWALYGILQRYGNFPLSSTGLTLLIARSHDLPSEHQRFLTPNANWGVDFRL
jgi:hypothetical protein